MPRALSLLQAGLRGVLRPTTVEWLPGRVGIAPSQCNVQRAQRQLLRHRLAHRPADKLARVQVQHQRQVQPAFLGWHVRHVGQPLLVRRRRLEVAPQDVRRHRVGVLRVRRHNSEAPPLVALQPVLAHDTSDPFVIDLAALRLRDLRRHSTTTIATSMFALRLSNLLDQIFIAERTLRRENRTIAWKPCAPRHRQQLAHHRRRIRMSMLPRSTRTSRRLPRKVRCGLLKSPSRA